MDAEHRTEPAAQAATLAMVALATVAIELAIADPGHPPAAVLGSAAAVLIAPMVGAALWLRRRPPSATARAWELAALVGLLVLPAVVQGTVAAATGRGAPLEVVLMAALRNLGLGLGAFAGRPAAARLAALVSLFLVMIASSVGEGRLVLAAEGAFAVAGVAWLMLTSWAGLAASKAGPRRAHPPVLAMIAWAGGFAVVLVLAGAVGPTRPATVLAELLASSGGTGDEDPDARGGVNDGANEVSASQDPRSIGFTESEVYLESDRPSLYDSFSDMYGEPIKPKAQQERMIAMAPQKDQPKDHPTENLRAGRTFATARQKPARRAGAGADRQAKALAYVKGETPLHLGLVTYEHFDGTAWEEEAATNQHCPLELVPGAGAWLRLDQPTTGPFAGAVRHQIKIGTLDSSVLPIPAHVSRLKVGSVNRPDFFGWAQAGLLRMVGRTVPAGTVIDAESRLPDPNRLRAISFGAEAPRPPVGRYLGLPPRIDPGVADLVRSWAAGIPRGWSQVEAVVAGVRGRCLHDRLVAVPDLGDAVGQFLLQSRCGPDHQFATATAVGLRLLGYPCRVVSGYYAAPGRYDPATRHTPVTAEDVHFWVEVLLPEGSWAAIEPTPGYELMLAPLAWGERIAEFCRLAWGRLRAHPLLVGAIVAALVALVAARRRLLDLLATLAWRVRAGSPARDRALRTLRLIELRSTRAGLRRPPGRTPARWYGAIAAAAPAESRAELDRLLAIAGWARHAPAEAAGPGGSPSEIELACRRAVRSWTLHRFLLHRRSIAPGGTRP